MSNIMTKRGSQDNVVTYEHYCDTTADLTNIPKNQITLGSIAVVLQDEDGGLGIYIASSNKEWIAVSTSSGGAGGGIPFVGKLPIHLCGEGEYDAETGKPTVESPEEDIFYLVPTGDSLGDDQFKAWVYSEGRWESWESMSVEIPQSDWNQSDPTATDYIKNKPAIKAGTGTSSILEASAAVASGPQSHAEGAGTKASGPQSHAEGGGTEASGIQSHAEGSGTKASGAQSHAEGAGTKASGVQSHAEGSSTEASGPQSHAEGNGTKALGQTDHSEGYQCVAGAATGGQPGNHAEGYGTKATGGASHAEGYGTTASGEQSHAEGNGTTASGQQSHAEGGGTKASEAYSHAEGGGTKATGVASHAEGGGTEASGPQSHAEGGGTKASGPQSHAEGSGTTANHASQHVFGEYNIADSSAEAETKRGDYVEIVGNGTKNDARSNARTLDWSGNEWLAGNLTAAGGSITIGATTITEAQLQALLALLNA